jgi:hypothetical protein
MPLSRKLDNVVLDLIESAQRTIKAAPSNLGGLPGAGGGVGGPPGGFIGYLPQTRVAYDTSEVASSGIPSSGVSLLDNLNHIRYRLHVIESGGAGGTITVIDDTTNTSINPVDTIHFSGGVVVTNLGSGDIRVTVSGGTGGLTQAAADSRYLKLDASNDPITGQLLVQPSTGTYPDGALKLDTTVNGGPALNINAGVGTIGLIATVGANSEILDLTQSTVNDDVSSDALLITRQTTGSGNITSDMFRLFQQNTGSGVISGDWINAQHGANTIFSIARNGLITVPKVETNLISRHDNGISFRSQNSDGSFVWIKGDIGSGPISGYLMSQLQAFLSTTELITNGTFNSSLTGWTLTGSPARVYDMLTNSWVGRCTATSTIKQTITVTNGDYYVLEYDQRMDSDSDFSGYVSITNGDQVAYNPGNQSGMKWNHGATLIKASSTSLILEFLATGGANFVYFDNITLKHCSGYSLEGMDSSGRWNVVSTSTTPLLLTSAGVAKDVFAGLVTGGDSHTHTIYQDWKPSLNTWTYSSADAPSFVISSNADETATMEKGTKVKYSQSQALTAYFPMDSNSTSTVGSFTSTDTSMTYTAGKFSNAAIFNGTTGKIVVTDTALLKPTGEFTIGMWFKTSNTGAIKGLFQTYSANTNVAGILFRINASNVLELFVGKNTGTTINVDYSLFTGVTNVTDNVYHYAVFSYRNNYMQLYLDGVLEASGFSFAPAYAATNYVRIGVSDSTGTDSNFMNGQIDDLYLINGYALDEKTVHDQYILATAQGTGNIIITKYGVVTKINNFSGGVTLFTIFGGTDFSLANATISSPSYSSVEAPFGFSGDKVKWSVIVYNNTRCQKTTPVANTWYGDTGLTSTGPSISVPIGLWEGFYKALVDTFDTTVTDYNIYITLSTGSSTESDKDNTSIVVLTVPSGTFKIWNTPSTPVRINISTKTTHYLNIMTTTSTSDNIDIRGDVLPTYIKLYCGYI